jgi:CDP-diacylglycerol--serine O-phosphatidyltransferase
MKRNVVVPNLLTACSLCCGLFVIFKMNMIHPGAAAFFQIRTAVEIILLATVLDVLDGAVARAMNVSTKFGGFFDSMADAVSFGVAPSVIVLKSLSLLPGTFLSGVLTAGAITYSLAGVLRLVRFSTTPPSEDIKEKGSFTGLPITASAMAVMSPTLLLMSDEWQAWWPIDEKARAMTAVVSFFFLAYLMVSRWKFPSLKSLNVRVTSTQLMLTLALFSSFFLIILLNSFSIVLFLVSWFYVLVAWMVAIIRLIRGKRQAALDDTEEDVGEEST